jgi:hypothetical protein
MRYSLVLLALTVLGLAGCVMAGAPSPPRASTNYMTPGRAATFMTPEESATLMTLPGDSTTVFQTRHLSTTSLNDDSGPPAVVWPQQ